MAKPKPIRIGTTWKRTYRFYNAKAGKINPREKDPDNPKDYTGSTFKLKLKNGTTTHEFTHGDGLTVVLDPCSVVVSVPPTDTDDFTADEQAESWLEVTTGSVVDTKCHRRELIVSADWLP